MRKMKVEIVYRQLNKYGEELCGDRIEVQSNGENKYFVLFQCYHQQA